MMAGIVMACGPLLLKAWMNHPFLQASTASILIALAMVAFTDDDAIPDDGWLEAALSVLTAHPEWVGVRGGCGGVWLWAGVW